MPKTRRVFDMVDTLPADPDLVRTLLISRSTSKAAAAFCALRGVVPDTALLMLVNMREIIAEIPETPFLTGHPLDALESLDGYTRVEYSYRRTFEYDRGGFTVEFAGQGTECESIVIETGSRRLTLAGDMDSLIDEEAFGLALEQHALFDEILRALQTLGVPLDPRVFVSPDDVTAEYAADSVDEMFLGSF